MTCLGAEKIFIGTRKRLAFPKIMSGGAVVIGLLISD